MTAQEIKETQKKYVLQSWSRQSTLEPIPIQRGENIYLYDYDGNRYADMSSLHVNMNLGYGNQEINRAIRTKLERYAFISEGYADEDRAKLAKMIVGLMGENMGKVFFTNAGADANENAIKIARMFTGRNKIFSRYRSYHGSSFGAGNLTGEPRRFPLEPGIPGFVKFMDPYVYRDNLPFETQRECTDFYLRRLEEQINYENPDNIAAIILETITGTNGVIIPPEGYLPGVRALCDKYGILMVCDEVMAGWCRTGKMFAFQHFGVQPDIVTFAKGVTCGYIQLGGVCVSEEIAAYFDDHVLSCGLTYNGHPLACAAGVACVQYYLDHDIAGHTAQVGQVLGGLLEDIKEKHPCVGDVRYIGLFSAVELVRDKATRQPLVPYGRDPEGMMGKVLAMLKARRFMTFAHENMVLVAPPLIITEEQLREELAKLDEVLSAVDTMIS
ncbi:MAG: aminotransferase class III-fold pyridoxal phosphate-dependent enzyme [Oscillospiraceae bacterium]|nr:aminotransferase class III-fold pyridoxal phosphate-dependent enzyme [Oscillospiraceae bacterium]